MGLNLTHALCWSASCSYDKHTRQFFKEKVGFLFCFIFGFDSWFQSPSSLGPTSPFSLQLHSAPWQEWESSLFLETRKPKTWQMNDPESRFPLGDTPIVTYLSSIRPQFPMVPAPPNCISLGTKPSIWKPLGVSKIYSIHLSETKEYLNMESLSTTH